MKARAHIDINHAFTVGVEEVSNLNSQLTSRVGRVELEAECADDVTRSFADLESLSKYENNPAKKIIRLRIESIADDREKTASIRFSDSEFGSIAVSISGPELEVERLRADLLAIVSGVRPWYAPLARFYSGFAIFYLFFAVVLGAFATVMVINKFVDWLNPAEDLSATNYDAVVLVLLVGFGAAWVGNEVRQRLFPIGMFTIGQGKNRHTLLEKLRWVWVSALVALLVSLFSVALF